MIPGAEQSNRAKLASNFHLLVRRDTYSGLPGQALLVVEEFPKSLSSPWKYRWKAHLC